MIWLGILFSLQLSWQLAGDFTPPKPGEEGDLQNQSYLPRLPLEAEQTLRSIDQYLQKGEVESVPYLLQKLSEILAAQKSENFADSTPVDFRLSIGIEDYLNHKINLLKPRERSIYQKMMKDRTKTQTAAVLAPGTEFSFQSWLKQGDLGFEKGDRVLAESCYRKAKTVLTNLNEDSEALEKKLQKRFQALSVLRVTSNPTQNAEKKNMKNLALAWSQTLDPETADSQLMILPSFDGQTLWIQTRKYLYGFDAFGNRSLTLNLDLLLFDRDLLNRTAVRKNKNSKNLVHKPLTDGQLVYLIHGDALPRYYANRLAAIRVNGLKEEIVWQRGWGVEKTEELQGFAFSPEMLLEANRLYVGAQKIRGEISSYLLCFEASTGNLLWKRLICKGAAANSQVDRLTDSDTQDIPGTAPVLLKGQLFYGTNLGVLACLDPADGSTIWSLRYARSKTSNSGWPWGRIENLGDELIFTPIDSDFYYYLRNELSFSNQLGLHSVLSEVPQTRGSFSNYLGSDPNRDYFMEEWQGNATLTAIERKSRKKISSVNLPAQELLDGNLLNDSLFLLGQQNLYGFDTKKELLLDEMAPFPDKTLSGNDCWSLPIQLPNGVACCVSNKIYCFSPGK